MQQQLSYSGGSYASNGYTAEQLKAIAEAYGTGSSNAEQNAAQDLSAYASQGGYTAVQAGQAAGSTGVAGYTSADAGQGYGAGSSQQQTGYGDGGYGVSDGTGQGTAYSLDSSQQYWSGQVGGYPGTDGQVNLASSSYAGQAPSYNDASSYAVDASQLYSSTMWGQGT